MMSGEEGRRKKGKNMDGGGGDGDDHQRHRVKVRVKDFESFSRLQSTSQIQSRETCAGQVVFRMQRWPPPKLMTAESLHFFVKLINFD